MFFSKKPLVSVCIPVFETEKYLERCLESVLMQNFTGIEIVIVDDGSSENSACKILKDVKKKSKIPLTFIKHEKNKGLLETRRSAVYEAKGDYILILDSDDTLKENAVKALYEKALESDADIVHGKAAAVFSETVLNEIDSKRSDGFKEKILKKINNVFEGELKESEILEGFLVNRNHQGFLWGKLFKKETYLEALSKIPPIYCTMAEDIIQYFWIASLSKKYAGIQNVVYNYSMNTGISSRTKITSLERWEKVCSTASVFTAIFSSIDENEIKLTECQTEALKAMCRSYVRNNLEQLKVAVIPELQNEAKQMLCDFWGKEMVEKMSGGNL